MKKIAFLTSGGDSPGMNACVRAIVKTCLFHQIIPYAIRDGFKGMIENDMYEISIDEVENIIHLGGTIIGTARSEEFKDAIFRKKAISNLKENGIDALIVIGGDGSFTGADILSNECNIPIIGIPGTIDNDIYGTDHTIGFDSALNTVIEAVDNIRDTSSSHHRVFLVEVMGRHSGFIALHSALASGVNSVLIPEMKTDIRELVEQITEQKQHFKSTIVIVAEGDDEGGASKIKTEILPFLRDFEIKTTVLGHVQRGGKPSAFDRILASKMGVKSVELLLEGKTKLMIGSDGEKLHQIPIKEGIQKHVNPLNYQNLFLFKKLLKLN